MNLKEVNRVARQYGQAIRKTPGEAEYRVKELACRNPDHGAYEADLESAIGTANALYRHGVSCCAKDA